MSAQQGESSIVNLSASNNSTFLKPLVNGGLAPLGGVDSNSKLNQHSEVSLEPSNMHVVDPELS